MSAGVPTGLLTRPRRLHFVGVGGAGMSGIAELCQRLGFEVGGCDLHDSATTARLAALGISIVRGHHPSHLRADLDAVTGLEFDALTHIHSPVGRRRTLAPGFEVKKTAGIQRRAMAGLTARSAMPMPTTTRTSAMA